MNIVLVNPDIPGNTGNIGRTCVGTDSVLHLVGRCGFSLEDRYLKRAGLDYWPNVDLRRHATWEDFLATVPSEECLIFFEKDGARTFYEAPYQPNSYLIFGSETRGFQPSIREHFAERFYRIPQLGPIRSLNLSASVAVAVYEALRQTRFQDSNTLRAAGG